MLESKMRWVGKFDGDQPIESLHPHSLINQMLWTRGLRTKEEVEKFLSPTKSHLHDPFLFEDMDRAVKRIHDAIDRQEPIWIYGDYDADGVTATALLVHTLNRLGANVQYYIPNRFTEGYGPNPEAFEYISNEGCKLLITVDNGIAAPEEAAFAQVKGMDLIITDHHEWQEVIPDAYAIIHPALSEAYPDKDLAGVGVAFKLAQALTNEMTNEMFAFAAIGTVADLVPLTGENRAIVKLGLEALSTTKLPGLEALKQQAKLKSQLTATDIGFGLGPRINAVGRLQSATLAVELLLEPTIELAEDMAKEVEALNIERQQLVASISKEAIEMIEANYKDDPVFVLANKGWNPGVLGIVASRIVNTYYRPTIMLAIDEAGESAKGSARSIPAFDLFKNGMEIKHLMRQFGGHAQAAGLSVDVDQIDELRLAFHELAEQKLTEEDYIPSIEIESIVEWDQIKLEFPTEIERLAPFGMGNDSPIFQINDVSIKEIRKIGANKNHIKITGVCCGQSIEAVGFNMGDVADQISPVSDIDLVGEIQINSWNGSQKLQVLIKDLRCQDWQLFDYRGKQFEYPKALLKENAALVYFNQASELPATLSDLANEINLLDANLVNDIEPNEIDQLILYDLPPNLEAFEQLIKNVQYQSLFVCFQTKQSTYFDSFPSRDRFKDLYKTIRKHEIIREKDRDLLAQAKKVSRHTLDFMLQVFFELDFVKIENGDVFLMKQVEARDLSESNTYQARLNQMEIEEKLYFSSTKDLKAWISQLRDRQPREGEVVYGL